MKQSNLIRINPDVFLNLDYSFYWNKFIQRKELKYGDIISVMNETTFNHSYIIGNTKVVPKLNIKGQLIINEDISFILDNPIFFYNNIKEYIGEIHIPLVHKMFNKLLGYKYFNNLNLAYSYDENEMYLYNIHLNNTKYLISLNDLNLKDDRIIQQCKLIN